VGCLIIRNAVQAGMQSIPAIPRQHKSQQYAGSRVVQFPDFLGFLLRYGAFAEHAAGRNMGRLHNPGI
jgi:hypothetical protein